MQDIDRFVTELSGAVWEQTVGVPLLAVEGGAAVMGHTFEGHVHILGPWTGTVVLQCSSDAARRAAVAFFADAAPDDEKQNMQDAVCELTNMIGGNLKALLAEQGGCTLSIPTVIEGTNFSVRIPHTRVVARQAFTAADAPVVVTVLKSTLA